MILTDLQLDFSAFREHRNILIATEQLFQNKTSIFV